MEKVCRKFGSIVDTKTHFGRFEEDEDISMVSCYKGTTSKPQSSAYLD